MANVRIDYHGKLMDGQKITFKAPCNCSQVDRIKVYYPNGENGKTSKEFVMKDSHGNDLTGLGNLFSEGAYVSVVLDTINNNAYLLNAATNKYLEEKLKNSGGGGNLVGIEMTQAEYDALPEEEKNNGLYFIIDGSLEENDTGWVALNDFVKYRVKNGICTIVGLSAGDFPLKAKDYITVVTIPNEIAPSIPIYFTPNGSGGDGGCMVGRIIDTTVSMYHIDNGAYWSFSVTYPID